MEPETPLISPGQWLEIIEDYYKQNDHMTQIPQEYSETSFQVGANIVKVLAENQSNNKLAIEFKVINSNYGLMTKGDYPWKQKGKLFVLIFFLFSSFFYCRLQIIY